MFEFLDNIRREGEIALNNFNREGSKFNNDLNREGSNFNNGMNSLPNNFNREGQLAYDWAREDVQDSRDRFEAMNEEEQEDPNKAPVDPEKERQEMQTRFDAQIAESDRRAQAEMRRRVRASTVLYGGQNNTSSRRVLLE